MTDASAIAAEEMNVVGELTKEFDQLSVRHGPNPSSTPAKIGVTTRSGKGGAKLKGQTSTDVQSSQSAPSASGKAHEGSGKGKPPLASSTLAPGGDRREGEVSLPTDQYGNTLPYYDVEADLRMDSEYILRQILGELGPRQGRDMMVRLAEHYYRAGGNVSKALGCMDRLADDSSAAMNQPEGGSQDPQAQGEDQRSEKSQAGYSPTGGAPASQDARVNLGTPTDDLGAYAGMATSPDEAGPPRSLSVGPTDDEDEGATSSGASRHSVAASRDSAARRSMKKRTQRVSLKQPDHGTTAILEHVVKTQAQCMAVLADLSQKVSQLEAGSAKQAPPSSQSRAIVRQADQTAMLPATMPPTTAPRSRGVYRQPPPGFQPLSPLVHDGTRQLPQQFPVPRDVCDQPLGPHTGHNLRALRESIVPDTFVARPFICQTGTSLPTVAGKPLVGDIETFSGEGTTSLSEWLDILNDKQDICGWSDTHVAAIIRDRVRGRARDAIRPLRDDARGLDKRALMQCLWNTFQGTAQGFSARAELHGATQGASESLYEYSKRLATLCARAYPDKDPSYAQDRALQIFELSVREKELRQYLRLQYPESLPAALQLAEAWTASRTPSNPSDSVYEMSPASEDLDYPDLGDDLVMAATGSTKAQAGSKMPDGAATPFKRVTLNLRGAAIGAFEDFVKNYQQNSKAQKPKGQKGSDQSHKRRSSSRGRNRGKGKKKPAADECLRCGKKGHWARNCKAPVSQTHMVDEDQSAEDLNE